MFGERRERGKLLVILHELPEETVKGFADAQYTENKFPSVAGNFGSVSQNILDPHKLAGYGEGGFVNIRNNRAVIDGFVATKLEVTAIEKKDRRVFAASGTGDGANGVVHEAAQRIALRDPEMPSDRRIIDETPSYGFRREIRKGGVVEEQTSVLGGLLAKLGFKHQLDVDGRDKQEEFKRRKAGEIKIKAQDEWARQAMEQAKKLGYEGRVNLDKFKTNENNNDSSYNSAVNSVQRCRYNGKKGKQLDVTYFLDDPYSK